MIRLAGAAPPPSFCALALVRSHDEGDETTLSSGEEEQERLVRALERRKREESCSRCGRPCTQRRRRNALSRHTHARSRLARELKPLTPQLLLLGALVAVGLSGVGGRSLVPVRRLGDRTTLGTVALPG